jgi:hypothetical protein
MLNMSVICMMMNNIMHREAMRRARLMQNTAIIIAELVIKMTRTTLNLLAI